MIAEWLQIFAIWLSILLFLKYLWSRRKLYILSAKLKGPPAFPIIGNGLSFMCHNSKILMRMYKLLNIYKLPMRFWLGTNLAVIFGDPKHVEKILTSNKITYKHRIYDFMKSYLGCGLISESGPRQKLHRKLIQPFFNTDFVATSMSLFQRHFSILVDVLEKKIDKGTFNIEKDVHPCFVDIIGDVILGANLESQFGQSKNFTDSLIKAYNVLYTRMCKPWLFPDFIFNRTVWKQLEQKHIYNTHSLVHQQIETVQKSLELGLIGNYEGFVPSIYKIVELSQQQPENLTPEEIPYHLLTLFAASEDTMTLTISFLCMCLGMNPEYQRKAAEEVREVLGAEKREILYEELSKLKYIEMCIKESLRLFPIAPFIVRRSTEEFKVDDQTYPEGIAVVIAIFHLHRNAEFWEKPHDFYPDHFLPEAVEKRPPYTFLPFSAGPRGCIGKIFAYAGLKLCLAYILQNYVLEADGKVPDIPLRADISVRPIHGYNLRLKRRIWLNSD